MTTPPTIHIAGPTAVGKTQITIQLAQQTNAEIISIDTLQIYQHLNIATAKPTPQQRALIPHHLIDTQPLTQPINLHQYHQQATRAHQHIQNKNKTTIYTGGAGLHHKTILHGLDPLPPPNPKLRQTLTNTPLPQLLQQLQTLDPQLHQTIDPHNPRRIIRALEIIHQTKQPLTQQHTKWKQPKNTPPLIILTRHPHTLRQRIQQRTHQMIQNGLIQETQHLLKHGLLQNPSARNAIGYRQTIQHLNQQQTLQQTIQNIQTQTWQYTRRQTTWYKHQPNTHWINLDTIPPHQHTQTILQAATQQPKPNHTH